MSGVSRPGDLLAIGDPHGTHPVDHATVQEPRDLVRTGTGRR
ncbi:hypothetical protein [Kitasatospora sp. NPDC057015]